MLTYINNVKGIEIRVYDNKEYYTIELGNCSFEGLYPTIQDALKQVEAFLGPQLCEGKKLI